MSEKVDTFLRSHGIDTNFAHYGVFGMKWGETKTAEEIQAEEAKKIAKLKKGLDGDETKFLNEKVKQGWQAKVDKNGQLVIKASVKSKIYKDFKNEPKRGFIDMRGDGEIPVRRSDSARKRSYTLGDAIVKGIFGAKSGKTS